MSAGGVAKLIEEVGELQQVLGKLQQTLGKRLAMWDQDEHWDGTNLRERMVEEMGDVSAAIFFVIDQFGLDNVAYYERVAKKQALFETWQAQLDNNDHGIDAPKRRDPTHGRIDFDIQDYVEEMSPKSVAQRVAIENTLQAKRDRGEMP